MQVQNNLQICIGHLIGIIRWPTQVRISPLFLALLPQILKHTHYVLDQVGLLLVLMDSSNPSVCVCKSTKKMHLISTKNKKGREKGPPILLLPLSTFRTFPRKLLFLLSFLQPLLLLSTTKQQLQNCMRIQKYGQGQLLYNNLLLKEKMQQRAKERKKN